MRNVEKMLLASLIFAGTSAFALALSRDSGALYLPFVSRPPLACEELMLNGGFEYGSMGWELRAARIVTGEYDWPQGHSGLLLSTEDTAFPVGTSHAIQWGPSGHWREQPYSVPADAKHVSFSFWYKLLTTEPIGRTPGDMLWVTLTKPPEGREHYYQHEWRTSCLGASWASPFESGWTQVVWDVTLLTGHHVRYVLLQFDNDEQYPSTLLLDGVSLQVCR